MRPVLRDAGLVVHDDRMTRRGRGELLAAREHALHRPAGLLRQQRQRRLLGDLVLAAEIAADDGADDTDAAHRHLQRARHVGARQRDAPDGRVDGEATVGVPVGDRRVRLERDVFDHLRTEAALEDVIGLSKAFFDIAFADHFGGVDVALRRVHLGRILAHGGDRIEHGRQRLVFDHDLVQRLVGYLLGDGRYRRNAVTGVEHDIVDQHRLVLERGPEGIDRDLLAGEHRHDAGHGLGRAGVDALDAGRRNAGALDARIEHAGEAQDRRCIWSARGRAGGRPAASRAGRRRGSAGGRPASASRSDRARAAIPRAAADRRRTAARRCPACRVPGFGCVRS